MVQIRDWVLATPPISPHVTCGEVYDMFRADADLLCLPVVQDGAPLGLADRNDVFLRLADHFGRPLFSAKSITKLMDASPLVIEGDASLDHLSRTIINHRPAALMRGFIVVENGRYLGVGTALALMNMRLAQEQARARELDDLRRAAEQASIAKSNFLATMSHELRTPLNAIIGFSDLILGEAFGPILPARYAEYVQDIGFSGKHLLRLINDILDMAKIESGQIELHPQPLDPHEIVTDVLRILATQIDRAGHDMLNALPPLPDLLADERCLRQILLNLISNAVKFTPAGGRIEIGGGRDGDLVALWVRDNGIGIAPHDMERVMRPFGQVESALTRQYEGTGLGLPLVKEMAEAMGGRFTLSSQPGDGTTATVHLPLHQPARLQAVG